ncbi:MAG: hypothetical protein AB4042_17450 [Leptolyngbyaceae cyanobacterium]
MTAKRKHIDLMLELGNLELRIRPRAEEPLTPSFGSLPLFVGFSIPLLRVAIAIRPMAIAKPDVALPTPLKSLGKT